MSNTSELFQKNPMAFIGNLEPKDKGQHYQVICPNCNKREAYIYKTGTIIKCNRANNCNYEISIYDLVGKEEYREIANKHTVNGQSFSNTKNKIKNTQEIKDIGGLFLEFIQDPLNPKYDNLKKIKRLKN